MLYYLFTTIYVLACIMLLLVVLLQQGKGDIAAAFGGGSSSSAFGARAGATVLTKATAVLAVLFMLGALSLAIIRQRGPGSVVTGTPGPRPAPVRPSPTPAAPAPAGAPSAPTGAAATPAGAPANAPATTAPASTPAAPANTTPAPAPKQVSDAVAVFASKRGAPTDPDWFRNLVAQPKASIEIGSTSYRVIARVAAGGERERIWNAQKAAYPTFAEYEAKAGRPIPAVVLDRA